jgi:hypothetical protein
MHYCILDLKNNEVVDRYQIKGMILPNLDREEMFEYCQKVIDQFQEQLEFLKPIDLDKFKRNLIQGIQKTSQKKQLYQLLEQNANLILDHEKDDVQEKEIKQYLLFLNEFQRFLLKYLWRVETKYLGEIRMN